MHLCKLHTNAELQNDPASSLSLLRLALSRHRRRRCSRPLPLLLAFELHPHLVSLHSLLHCLPVPHLAVVGPKYGANGDAGRQA